MSLFAKSGGACLADAPRFELRFLTARWSPDFWKFVDPIAAWNQSQLAAWAGAAKVVKMATDLAFLLVVFSNSGGERRLAAGFNFVLTLGKK